MSLSLFNLSGKRALITGGTQGIGFSIAKGLGEAGASLVINARNSEKLVQCIQELQSLKIEAKGALFDVTNAESVKEAIHEIETHIGSIDILVNNAGIIRRAPAEGMKLTLSIT